MEKQLSETYQIQPIRLQHINTLAVNPYVHTCNIYACCCTRSLSEQCWNADSTEIRILIWLGVRVEGLSAGANPFRRVGKEIVAKEVRWRGRGRVWWQGGLPVALAPTGSNLEQTVPNVFIRLWLGWAQVGRACPAWRWIVLIVPSIKRHLFQWGNEGERERGMRKEEGATGEKSCFMMSRQFCVLTRGKKSHAQQNGHSLACLYTNFV